MLSSGGDLANERVDKSVCLLFGALTPGLVRNNRCEKGAQCERGNIYVMENYWRGSDVNCEEAEDAFSVIGFVDENECPEDVKVLNLYT